MSAPLYYKKEKLLVVQLIVHSKRSWTYVPLTALVPGGSDFWGDGREGRFLAGGCSPPCWESLVDRFPPSTASLVSTGWKKKFYSDHGRAIKVAIAKTHVICIRMGWGGLGGGGGKQIVTWPFFYNSSSATEFIGAFSVPNCWQIKHRHSF